MSLQTIAQKYINMLPKSRDGQTMPMPDFVLVNMLSATWNGIAIWNGLTEKSVIKIQKRVMGDPNSLSRVVAHEICHAWTYWMVWKREQRGPWHKGHGVLGGWYEAAQIVNQREGKDFITQTSDKSYVTENDKPFWIFVEQQKGGKIRWAWFSRVTDTVAKSMRDKIQTAWVDGRPVSIVKVTDARYLLPGAKLPTTSRYMDMPKDLQEALEQILRDPIPQYDPRDIKDLVSQAKTARLATARRPIRFSR